MYTQVYVYVCIPMQMCVQFSNRDIVVVRYSVLQCVLHFVFHLVCKMCCNVFCNVCCSVLQCAAECVTDVCQKVPGYCSAGARSRACHDDT